MIVKQDIFKRFVNLLANLNEQLANNNKVIIWLICNINFGKDTLLIINKSVLKIIRNNTPKKTFGLISNLLHLYSLTVMKINNGRKNNLGIFPKVK